jgi:hypothetical protein
MDVRAAAAMSNAVLLWGRLAAETARSITASKASPDGRLRQSPAPP